MNKRVIGVIIKDDKILLMRRVKEGREYFVFPGGGVGGNESLEEGVIREIKEEFNLDVKIDKLLFQIENQGRREFYFLIKEFSGIPEISGEEKKRMNENNQYYPVWKELKEISKLSNLYPEEAKILLMSLPKVKFTNIPLSKEVDWIHGFLFRNKRSWGKYIIKKHPKIKKVFSLKTEVEQVKFLKKYVIEFRKYNQKTIEKNKEKYQKEWRKVEKNYFETLSEIMEIDWPKSRKIIKAMMSLNPICPRFLNDWSFSIFYNYKKISHAMEVIMHECCHFLYFEKWKKIYPKMNHKKFESPHIEWHLSELVAPIILNDKHIQKLLKQKAAFYREYYKIKIKNKPAPAYFANLYKKYIKNGFDFFLNMAYREIKRNRKLFTD